ncbi:heavy-metal-associated domain-containing protein [Microbacterium sp. NPDC076911]|uniref:heavy-metal-associated domain-containing protein n=1 Tax=Microbacterium sp. NPDC076911 TaxID=3154958 RepID=UPI0034352BE8
MTTTVYNVTGMSCDHCEVAVRNEVAKLPGVDTVEVSALRGILTIESSTPLDDASVLEAVDEAGYEAARA